MQDNEFAGRLDFNQHTREINVSDILLEVQSAQTKRDGCVCYPSALNSKTAKSTPAVTLASVGACEQEFVGVQPPSKLSLDKIRPPKS